ncbi:MAG: PKD domain-containing protein, partial [Bacteroidaceae bacterium]|nr:PKD domain-containing protein [Bacteroidaceae bacterium]
MQILKSLLTLLALAATTMVSAQPGTWDREKYPDLPSPTPTNINMKTYWAMAARIQRQKEQGIRRPDHVNNALNPSFPPIINQSGGSCGAACSIYYQFTNQINTSRFTAADSDDRRYATHFPWLLNANGPEGTGYERLGHNVGIASCTDYGGTTYSRIFGNSGQSDADDDCGWMQGYDRWFNTMHNRILRENSFPYNCGTEEGRELVKNYLWNRCGDDSYASGGICGIGVAAGPFEGIIPKTEANDAAGVTGMKYVTDWNETYNHAMTIVGYDDRLEFDLDGNGVIGETSNSKGENEVGAWIICNSWGDGYANKGFIYCPYEKSNSVKGWPKENSFTPGYFDVMRNYRPLRTLRINMEYSHRSEVALFAGVAQDLEAAEPEKSLRMTHFEYCGDGNRSKTQPAPAIPMLGRWADGELHYEPMEFGYDLTELTQDFDLSRPLKYFFWIETQPWGEGKGKLHEVTLIDYVIDRQGTETPLLVGEPLQIRSAGKKTMVSGIAYAQYVPEPRNPNFQADLLAWEKPAGTSYPLKGYNIYKDEELFTSVGATTLQVSCPEMGCYTVRALYAVDGNDLESKATKAVAPPVEVLQTPVNKVLNMSFGSQLTIPNVCRQSMKNFTLEFWMGALVFRSPDSFGVKAMNGESTASFFFKVNSDKKIEVGHDGGDRATSKSVLKPRTSYHIAIVSEGLVTKVYVNGELWINWTSGYNHAGIDKACDLIFGMTEGTTTNYKEFYAADWYGWVDEIRFWDYSRTQEEIQEMYDDMIANPYTYPGLTHCYQMTTRTDSEGNVYLIDGKGQHDALVNNPDKIEVQEKTLGEDYSFLRPEPRADFAIEGKVIQGIPVRVKDLCSPSVVHRTWTATGTATPQLTDVNAPSFVFSEPGTQTITLKAQSLFGAEATKSVEVEVLPAALPEVDFSIPEGDIAAGQHITFLNTSSPVEMASYEWEIEGAEIPVVKTINGAATFLATGTYDVTLTATNNLGSVSKTKQVSVVGVKPQAAFSIGNNVALVGEPFTLIDESRYAPQQWTWEIASGVEIYKVKGQHKAVKLD